MRTSVLVSIGVIGLALAGSSAHATTYTVTTTNMTEQWGDGCSLTEAISAAFWNAANHECAAGTADDTINLGGGTYVTDWKFFTADTVTINGSGVSYTIIQGRFLNNPQEELFSVNGNLTLNNMTLEYTGPQNLFSSGIAAFTDAHVTAENVRITKFTWAGVRADNAGLSLTHMKIDNNKNIFPQSGWNDGGGIQLKADIDHQGQGLLLENSSIINNTANGNGGGIYFGASGGSNLYYNTIAGNTAARGGGIYIATVAGGYFHARHQTVGSNTATISGGGIEEHHGGSLLEFDGCLVTNNSAPTGANMIANAQAGNSIDTIWGSGVSSTSLGCAPAARNWTCTHNSYGVSASFGPLMTMGGAYNWMEVLPTRKGSSAIDFNAAAGALPLDQRGIAGNQDGNNNGSSAVDAGAFEKNLVWQSEDELQWTNSANDLVNIDVFSSYSGGLGRRLSASGVNDWVQYPVPIVESGTYDIIIRYKKTSNAGQFRVGTSTSPTSGFTWFTPNQEGYSGTTTMSSVINLGPRTFSAAGKIYVRFQVMGKAGASNGYDIYTDYVKVWKTN
jgi:parallel beta-helix repeat protein